MAGGDRIRAWSVGCATCEEAYSLAMLLQERPLRSAEGVSFQDGHTFSQLGSEIC
ncbi:CheR family methyltransferase [Paraburkholderia hospita]